MRAFARWFGAMWRRWSPLVLRGTAMVAVEIKGGPVKGQWLVCDERTLARYRYLVGNHEPEVADMLRRHCRPGDVVADIGAHIGYFTLLLSDLVGNEGRVHAFEPSPEPFAALSEAIAMNDLRNVSAHNLAASSLSRSVPFRSVVNRSTGRISYDGGIEVHAVSLDGFLEGRLDFVKMDVEGAELAVLLGMERILNTMRPTLLIEVHDKLLSPTDRTALFGILERHRYRVTGVGTPTPRRGTTHVLALPG